LKFWLALKKSQKKKFELVQEINRLKYESNLIVTGVSK